MKRRGIPQRIQDALSEQYPCYVLIACDAPSDDGQMEVEMSYDGDPTLAAYLLQGAQNYLDEQIDLVDQ